MFPLLSNAIYLNAKSMVVLGGQHKGLILSTVKLRSSTDLNVHSLIYQDSFKALGDNLIESHTVGGTEIVMIN